MLWFWWWLLFVVVFLLMPLGYGWGYRDWGWPRYRRVPASLAERARVEQLEREEAAAEAAGWGALAIVFRVMSAIAVVWFVLALAAAA